MNFVQWLYRYPRWDTIGWLVVIGVSAYWEIMGVFRDRTTFTDLVRSVLPQTHWLRLLIVGGICAALFWHFYIQKANWK